MSKFQFNHSVTSFQFFGVILLLLISTACQTSVPAVTEQVTMTPTPTREATAIPTFVIASPTLTPTSQLSPTRSPTVTATVNVQSVSLATRVPPTATATEITPFEDHYFLSRPIPQEADFTHWIDLTYPYGGTQFGAREVHLGVEFYNGRFTPIIAAADGEVVFAGSDDSTEIGPDTLDYYGNLVIIRHEFLSAEGLPVFTLYGHLQDLQVQAGQVVARGQQIGRVGDTGIAIGPHLHFEVRVGNRYDYRSTRNPALWLVPYPNNGTLAGYVSDDGVVVAGAPILIRGEGFQRETYTYGSQRVNSDPAWNENFAIGDLPAGNYEVIIRDQGGRLRYRGNVTIEAARTAFLDIELE